MFAFSQPPGEVSSPLMPNKAAAVEPLRLFSDAEFLNDGYKATTVRVYSVIPAAYPVAARRRSLSSSRVMSARMRRLRLRGCPVEAEEQLVQSCRAAGQAHRVVAGDGSQHRPDLAGHVECYPGAVGGGDGHSADRAQGCRVDGAAEADLH